MTQEQMLRIEREFPALPQFNLPFAYRLRGPLSLSALKRSLAEVLRRHDALRMRFTYADGRPVALIVSASEIKSPLVVEDLAGRMPGGDARAKALLLRKAQLEAEQEAWTPIDTRRAPLLRMRLLRLGADDHVLLIILHHIIVDGWSVGVLIEELSELYAASAAGGRAQLPDPTHSLPDFARWQRRWSGSEAATRQLVYWRHRLRGASPLFPAADDLATALLCSPVAHEPVRVPRDLVACLRSLSHRQGATLFMTLLAGFKTLLMARSGRNDICVATAMANRSQLGTERTIGPLVNTTLIRTQIDPDMSFRDALGRVRDSVLDAYARQELPFEIVAARLAEEDDLDPASLLQASFILQNASRPLKFPDVTVRSFAYPDGQRLLPIDRTWLSVVLKETPSGVGGACNYKSDLFEADTVRRWIADYTAILVKAAANPGTPIGRLVERIAKGAATRAAAAALP
jgi:hypothetical protein